MDEELKKPRKPYGMPKGRDKFCMLVVSGMSQTDAYKQSYPKCNNPHSRASVIMRDPRVIQRLKDLREYQFKANELSKAEKRDFLARIVRTPVTEIEGTDLHQGNGKFGPEMPSKIAAIVEDSKLSGDYFADQPQNMQNPFGWLIQIAGMLQKPQEKLLTAPASERLPE